MGLPVINGQPNDYCDVFGRIQVTPYDNQIKFTSNFTSPSRFFYNQSKGGYDMDAMILTYDYKDPNYLELKFECPSVKIPVYKNNTIVGFNQNFNLFAQVKTFPCQPGESYYLGACTVCNPLIYQYNVAVNEPYCSQMNDNMMLAVSQAGIQLRPGFWRPYFTNDASEKCSNLQANCLGGWIPGDASCYKGHIGALCESCDIYAIQNSEIYTTTGQFQCTTCSSTSKFNTAIIAITSFIGFISMILAVQGAFEQLKTKLVEEALKNMGVLLKPEGGNLATLMKVFTNYFQIIQFISTFQISIPTSITSGAKTAGSPAGSATSSTDCAIINISDVDILYFRTMWAMLLPAFYLTGFIAAYLIAVAAKLTPYKKTIVTTALIYQFLFLQPTFVAMFMPLASSRTISNTPWVQQDVAYRYDSSTHQFWLAVYVGPMLLLWVLILPLLFMFLVWQRRFELEAKQTRMTFGFFYNEYETNSYLWEFIKIFEKQAMVIILSYYAADIIVKGLLLVLVLILYGAYQVSVVPYKSRVLNGCDRMSTAVCAISLCLGVLWYSSQQNEGQGYLQAIIFVIIIFINLPFIVYLLLLIFEGYLIQFGPQIDKVRDKVNAKYPDIKNHTIRKLFINKEKMDKRVKFLWGVLRENVWATLELQRTHQVKFYKIFPPYDPLEIECHTEEEKQPLNLGQIQLQDGSVINQHVDNGLVFNRGTMIQSTGVVFTGNFQELKQHGVGIEVWPDQTEYQGQYVNGKKNGYGKIVWKATNESYVGNFTNDLFDGEGTYTWANGQTYEGHWKQGKRHGFGKQTSETQIYEGEFENDLYHGKGKMTMGIKSLQGKWLEGKLQGEVMIKVKNSTRRGIFAEGKFVKWV